MLNNIQMVFALLVNTCMANSLYSSLQQSISHYLPPSLHAVSVGSSYQPYMIQAILTPSFYTCARIRLALMPLSTAFYLDVFFCFLGISELSQSLQIKLGFEGPYHTSKLFLSLNPKHLSFLKARLSIPVIRFCLLLPSSFPLVCGLVQTFALLPLFIQLEWSPMPHFCIWNPK